jgi:aminoglycoside phosphotransferase (APT) family kinase protein
MTGRPEMEVVARSIWSMATLDLRRLRRQPGGGLTPCTVYGIFPGPAGEHVFIPLDVPAAWRWYVHTLARPRSARGRLLVGALRRAGGALNAARYLVRRVVVVKQDSRGTGRLRAVVLSGQRLVVFAFRPGAASPAFVIKIPARAADNAATEGEHRVLRHLRGSLSSPADVPSPLSLITVQSLSVAIESVVGGTPLDGGWRPGAAGVAASVSRMRACASWLIRFHQETEIERRLWLQSAPPPWFAASLEPYERRFPMTRDERVLFAAAREHAQTLTGTTVPLVYQHRDFRPANVLWDDGHVRVVDWEGCRPGAPLADLLHFMGEWQVGARRLDGRDARRRAFRALFLEGRRDRIADAAAEALGAYLAALRLDARLVPLILLCTWTELAVRTADRARSGSTAGQHDNDDRAIVRMLAAGGGALFRRGGLGGPAGLLARAGV